MNPESTEHRGIIVAQIFPFVYSYYYIYSITKTNNYGKNQEHITRYNILCILNITNSWSINYIILNVVLCCCNRLTTLEIFNGNIKWSSDPLLLTWRNNF